MRAADAKLHELLTSPIGWRVGTKTMVPWAAVIIHLYTMPQHADQTIAVHEQHVSQTIAVHALVNKTLLQQIVPPDPRTIAYAKVLYKALPHAMVPTDTLEFSTVYRSVAANMLPWPFGGTRACPEFVSTSCSRDVADEFQQRALRSGVAHVTMITIGIRTARCVPFVENFSALPEEREVLLPHGTELRRIYPSRPSIVDAGATLHDLHLEIAPPVGTLRKWRYYLFADDSADDNDGIDDQGRRQGDSGPTWSKRIANTAPTTNPPAQGTGGNAETDLDLQFFLFAKQHDLVDVIANVLAAMAGVDWSAMLADTGAPAPLFDTFEAVARRADSMGLTESLVQALEHAAHSEPPSDLGPHDNDVEEPVANQSRTATLSAPDAITCPLSKAVMGDPVAASDGHVYDRGALAGYLEAQLNKNELPLSPMTGTPLTDIAAALQACPVAAATVAVWNECNAAQQAPSSHAAAALNTTPAAPPPGIKAHRLDEAEALTDGDLAAVGLGSADFDDKLPVPTLVAVGQRNAGKSTLLEALVGLSVFPRGTPTRVTVRVVLLRGPAVDPYMRVAPIGTPPTISQADPDDAAAEFPWRRIPAAILTQHDRLPDVVHHVMDHGLGAPTASGTEHGYITDREIQLVVQTPTTPHLQLLDLPGLIGEGNPGHEAVKALLKSAVDSVNGTARFLWVHSATTEGSAKSSVGALLHECGVADRTTGVLTNCDRVRNDDPDAADVSGIAALLRDDEAEHSRAVGGGWIAVANVPLPDQSPMINLPQREAAALRRLCVVPEDTTDAELAQFDADVALVSAHWGMDRLRQHEQAAYDAVVKEHWDPHMRRCILRRLEQEHMRLGSLGVPFAVPTDPEKDGAVDSDFEEVRRFVSARADELPLAAACMSSAPQGPGDLAAAIMERFSECVRQFQLAAAGDGALARARGHLDAAVRFSDLEDRTFTGQHAEHSALSHAKSLAGKLEAAAEQYQTAVRRYIEDDGEAGLVGSFMRFVRRPDGPKMSSNGEGHTLVLQLYRFEGALARFEELLRERVRRICFVTSASGAAFQLRAVDRPSVVRCIVDSANVMESADAWHWRAAATVADALSNAVVAFSHVAAAVKEVDSATAQRTALFQRCVRLCRLHGSPSAAAAIPLVEAVPCLAPTETLPRFAAALRQYSKDQPLVRLETRPFRLATIPDGICTAFSALRTVDLSEFAANAIGADFCAGCPLLTTVRITSLQRTVRSVGARFLADCPQLEAVDLSGLAGVETVGARCLAHCPKLFAVDVTVFSATVTTLGSHFLHGSCPEGEFASASGHHPRWSTLRDVNLFGFNCAVVVDNSERNGTAVRDAENCDGKCEENLDEVLTKLATAAPLTNLTLAGCPVTDVSIALVAQHCPQLQHLDVRGSHGKVTDASIAAVAAHCPHLQHLDVSWTEGKVTDASIVAVAEHCPQLQHLNVSRTCGKVTDASIGAVAAHCPQLQHLDVCCTSGAVTDVSITAVAQHCPQLQHLDVFFTKGNVTDASIVAVAQHCLQLRYLNASWTCGKVTDTSIAAVAAHCPQLQHLDVSFSMGRVTDASIKLLAQHCRQLQQLNVRFSEGKVTDASIALVAQQCPELRVAV